MTVAQKFHNYYAQYSPAKEILNVGTSLTIEFELNLEELRKAIYKAYDRCESMRARLAYDRKEKEWYQYIVEKEERAIEFVDFTEKSMEEAEDEMTAWTRIPFDKEDSPMNRVVIIKTPDGFEGLFIVGDHRFLDAQSLIGFLKDVIELYCSANFEGIPYPADMRSYTEQIERDLAYEAGSRAQARDRAYFLKQIEESEPIYNGIEGPGKLEACPCRLHMREGRLFRRKSREVRASTASPSGRIFLRIRHFWREYTKSEINRMKCSAM